MKKTSIAYTIVFTFLCSFLFVFLLSLANEATEKKVAENQIESIQKSVLQALGLPIKNSVSKTYAQYFSETPQQGDTLFVNLKGDEIRVKYFSGSGLWGTITGILALDESQQRIKGVDFISHNETPGLGGRIDEKWFKDQFINEKIGLEGITVNKGNNSVNTDSDDTQVDGITGASLTSKSVEKIINTQIKELQGGQAK